MPRPSAQNLEGPALPLLGHEHTMIQLEEQLQMECARLQMEAEHVRELGAVQGLLEAIWLQVQEVRADQQELTELLLSPAGKGRRQLR